MSSPVPRGPKRPSVISPMVLADPQTALPAEANALVTDDDDRRMVLIELLVGAGVDPDDVRDQFLHMFHRVLRDEPPTPTPVGRHYVRCMLTPDEIQRLVRGGAKSPTAKSAQQALQLIRRVWPDLVVEAHLDR